MDADCLRKLSLKIFVLQFQEDPKKTDWQFDWSKEFKDKSNERISNCRSCFIKNYNANFKLNHIGR
jgi:hypothetical protein